MAVLSDRVIAEFHFGFLLQNFDHYNNNGSGSYYNGNGNVNGNYNGTQYGYGGAQANEAPMQYVLVSFLFILHSI